MIFERLCAGLQKKPVIYLQTRHRPEQQHTSNPANPRLAHIAQKEEIRDDQYRCTENGKAYKDLRYGADHAAIIPAVRALKKAHCIMLEFLLNRRALARTPSPYESADIACGKLNKGTGEDRVRIFGGETT